MGDFHEQRICVKICFKLGKSFSETFAMLKQAFEDEAMSRTQSHDWHIRFKEGRTSIEDNERPGRSSTSKNEENIQKIRKVIRSNCHLTVREVAEEVGILKATCHEILTPAVGTATICTPKEHLCYTSIRKVYTTMPPTSKCLFTTILYRNFQRHIVKLPEKVKN
jgi:DNA-binding XRE family transcriptional regulator